LAIMPRPRGGDWLEDEVRSWRRTGIDVVVSLLTPDEVADFSLTDEEELCAANAIQFLSFAITDRSAPSSRPATVELLTRLVKSLTEAKNVAIHCRQGIGRAGLIAASLLVMSGTDVETAMARVSAARGCTVPETPEQHRWITEFAATRTPHSPSLP
jgi:protein-tyrosine phosphatase